MTDGIRYVDEFRDPQLAQSLLEEIHQLTPQLMQGRDRPLQIMEVCGGHTHSIFRYGLNALLPKDIEFVHGPGCPVCVLPMGRIDDCLNIARRENVIIASFGDAMRVPGSSQSLLQARAEGADIRMVYSPEEALNLARQNPDREVVFFAIGFETTMPSTCFTVMAAARDKVENFSIFCNHITIVSTIKAILDSPDMRLDGLLGPGHVSMVIGTEVFEFVADHYQLPFVVAGFEPLDILQAVYMVIKQRAENRAQVENQYSRVVISSGNAMAIQALGEVFQLREVFEWRGLGAIDYSAVSLTDKYRQFDAEKRFAIANVHISDPSSCQCGEVLKGVIKPRDCKVFGQSCTPEQPLGALMVSSEGACAAYYRYAHKPMDSSP
ncbi:hydrogenase formation protein HypD [Spongiibacter sp.]|uniref:hydrogenase formation protein HypD n=1 Tax=Spongiibacter sp. TaxID=2024860 RepID=UPI003563A609